MQFVSLQYIAIDVMPHGTKFQTNSERKAGYYATQHKYSTAVCELLSHQRENWFTFTPTMYKVSTGPKAQMAA